MALTPFWVAVEHILEDLHLLHPRLIVDLFHVSIPAIHQVLLTLFSLFVRLHDFAILFIYLNIGLEAAFVGRRVGRSRLMARRDQRGLLPLEFLLHVNLL